MPPFEIRSALPDDAAAIAYVQYTGWQETYRGIINDAFLDAMSLENSIERWKKNLQRTTAFMDVMTNSEGEVIAYISGGKNRPGALACEAEIYALYLLKKYHGLGLGKQIFVHGVNHLSALGYRSFCLYVLKENPTILFYKKFNPDVEDIKKERIGEEEYDDVGLGWSDINKFGF